MLVRTADYQSEKDLDIVEDSYLYTVSQNEPFRFTTLNCLILADEQEVVFLFGSNPGRGSLLLEDDADCLHALVATTIRASVTQRRCYTASRNKGGARDGEMRRQHHHSYHGAILKGFTAFDNRRDFDALRNLQEQ